MDVFNNENYGIFSLVKFSINMGKVYANLDDYYYICIILFNY